MLEDPQPDFAELLEGLAGAERASRLALVERLHAAGCTIGELRAAHAMGRLPLLPVERLLARNRRHSLLDAARAAGVSDAYADVNHRSLGLRSRVTASRYTTTTRSRTSRCCAACSTWACTRRTSTRSAASSVAPRIAPRRRWSTCSHARCCARETRRTTSRCGLPTLPRRRSPSSTA